jgi:hypothetical protein
VFQQPDHAAKPASNAGLQWPTPLKSSEQLPDPTALVLAWKPLINGWDIILGRDVVAAPAQFTHWLPVPSAPE